MIEQLKERYVPNSSVIAGHVYCTVYCIIVNLYFMRSNDVFLKCIDTRLPKCTNIHVLSTVHSICIEVERADPQISGKMSPGCCTLFHVNSLL